MTKQRRVTPGYRQLQRQVKRAYELAEQWMTGRTAIIQTTGKILKRELDLAKLGKKNVDIVKVSETEDNDD